jgi:hypothetical protein
MRALLAACALLGGCALMQPPPKPAPLGPAEIPSVRRADYALTAGRSTKADVRAALGEAVVVDFDSGYEVWVYRERRAELVFLFAPSGILTKTRVQ